MPKYLIEVDYSAEGARGLLAKGGSARRDAATSLAESVGGTVEAFYFAFGGTDVYVIIDVPDNATAAAISLTVGASGAMAGRTTVLLTPEEIDAAAQKKVSFTPMGQ